MLGIAALLIAVLGIGAYVFRGHISHLWLQTVTVPRMNSLLSMQTDGVDIYEAKIVQRIPHNPKNFVQGLQFDGDVLWSRSKKRSKNEVIVP